LGVTDFSLGAQYRFALGQPQLVPFVGIGLDLLQSDAAHGRDIDTTVGGYLKGGADYFISRQLALTLEAKIVVAPDADISGPTGSRGSFDPTSIATTFGVRYFFN
jgi:outer membrane protein